jgi:tyrosyl-tRNA synthetase
MPDTAQTAAAQARALCRDAVDCLPVGGLESKLEDALRQGRQLRVKLGIDPTAPDIHLGHAVVLRKLRQFQDAGHRVVLIVGDYTAQVGDPSGRSTLRPILTAEQIDANAATFAEQALLVLDGSPELLEIRRNGEWLNVAANELLGLMRTCTVAQVLEREDFAQRMASSAPISMLELLYPLLQGYDSVVVAADVELGGTDQKFNLLLGRDIQRAYGKPEQAIVTMPILVGLDGHRKMSKSLGNQIGITEPGREIFGKTMKLPDEAMEEYYRLLLGREMLAGLAPRDAKRALAGELVAWLHTPEEAALAERQFEQIFVEGGTPDEVSELTVEAPDGMVHLPAAIGEAFGISRSQARRLIEQGGVELAGQTLPADALDLPLGRLDGQVLKVGKRRFVRLRAA